MQPPDIFRLAGYCTKANVDCNNSFMTLNSFNGGQTIVQRIPSTEFILTFTIQVRLNNDQFKEYTNFQEKNPSSTIGSVIVEMKRREKS